MNTTSVIVLFSLGAATTLTAAPKLRLTQTAIGPISIAQGSNGPAIPMPPCASNAGDGSLNLKLTASDAWLVPTLGAPTSGASCQGGPGSIPVQISLQTSSLAKGSYTGFVTVSDSNAVDAPQTISVTINIGGNVPDQLSFYTPPGGTATTTFFTANGALARGTTASGGSWLSVAATSLGSFQFSLPYVVNINAGSLAAGDYSGSIPVSGSPLAADNKNVAVALHVTTQPIAQPTSTAVAFRIAQGSTKQSFPVALTNAGQGTLTVSTATVTTASGGSWLTAQTGSNNLITLTADPSGVSPGTYQGTLTINSNAVNGPTTVPVGFTILAPGPPVVSFGGAVNNGTFMATDFLAQGDITAVFGDQFTTGDPVGASSLPLGTTLGGTQVLINNQPVPIYYVSAGQINFQIPYDAPTGNTTLSVVRNSQQGNTISIQIRPIAPQLISILGNYAVMTTPQFALTGIPGAPAHAGDVIVLYALGLGQTSPPVTSGAASPFNPLAALNPVPQVCLGSPNPVSPFANCVTPQFAGLTPGFVGLYQVNFTVPQRVPTGDVPIYLQVGNALGSVSLITIQ